MRQLDLAPVVNCAIASLVDRNGRHVWHCHPRLDGDPVFNALVNGESPETGYMDVVLRDLARTEQAYVRNTPVLETILEDRHGARVRVYDLAPRFERFGLSLGPEADAARHSRSSSFRRTSSQGIEDSGR